tara:strand:- start:413 stop:979 length:567 start_codon:yes stop_codon:yes gene_type:complete
MNDIINNSIKNHTTVLRKIDNDLLSVIEKSAKLIVKKLENSSTIFWCGNGGSAAQANHLSAELVGGMFSEKVNPFKSICLNTDTSFITAWSNDDSFDNIFKRQLEALSCKEDILIVLSTSGNSQNIINAAEYAKDNKIDVISLTGNDGGKLKKISDINVNIDSQSTARIQEMHILIGHIICEIIEKSS